ncbi:MAG: hypothetical protein KDB53_10100 [Planctomycetes bacterium]|nr:hypothetical protein [Planctomycetota bacterium]
MSNSFNARFAMTLALVFVVGLPATVRAFQEDERAKAEVQDIAKSIGAAMNFTESPHFTFCTSMSSAQVGPILGAAEKAYGLWAKHVGSDNWRSLWAEQKAMVVICPSKREYQRYLKWYADKYPVWSAEEFVKGHSQAQWFPEPATRNVLGTHHKPHSEDFLKQIVVHLVGHMIIDRYAFNNNFTPAWLREGMGMWMEAQVLDGASCACYQGAYGLRGKDADRGKQGLPRAKLHTRVKNAITKHEGKNTKGITVLAALDQLSFDDMLTSYALIDWMMSQPKGLANFLRAMKQGWPAEVVPGHLPAKTAAQEKAFKKVFDMTFEQVDEALQEHVKTL